jgi:hypothetical protein
MARAREAENASLPGRRDQNVDSTATIAISSPERTVVDLLRLRSRVGRDLRCLLSAGTCRAVTPSRGSCWRWPASCESER